MMDNKVYNAYSICTDNRVGLIITKDLKRLIDAEIYALLCENQDQCIAYDWALNHTYEEDGKQIIINYPSDIWRTVRERIKDFYNNESYMHITPCLFTECDIPDKVEDLCQQVALEIIKPEEEW